LVTIPEVNLQKGKQNSWTVEVWIADELFYYAHPFVLPDLFQRKLTKHQFEVLFVKEGPYWEGTTLQFSGSKANLFYSLAQKRLISWEIFSSKVLSQFDLHYLRELKTNE